MSRCYGRYIGLEGTDCFVCDVCGAWCEGPCAGLTDDEVRQWDNDRGEPAAAARPGDEEEDGGGDLPDDEEDGDLLRCSGVSRHDSTSSQVLSGARDGARAQRP